MRFAVRITRVLVMFVPTVVFLLLTNTLVMMISVAKDIWDSAKFLWVDSK